VEELDDVIPPIAHEAREEDWQRVLDAWDRKQAEHPIHLSAQPATTDEDESIAMLGVLVGELHGDSAAEGLTDHRDPLDAEDTQEVAQRAGLGAQGVIPRWFGGLAVSNQIRRDDGVVAREKRN
jgi:hypothetical protein